MRLDKYLSDNLDLSRSEIKAEIKKGLVKVNGIVIYNADEKVSESSQVEYNGKAIFYEQFRYFILNKPSGCITATYDEHEKTVMDYIHEPNKNRLSPVGRLDKDTEGLLLITDDGALSHRLLSPKSHVEKTYFAQIEHSLSETDIALLSSGVDIGDEKPTLPAKIKIMDDTHIELTIVEGRFHQVKRMLEAVDNKVLYLKRISFGDYKLGNDICLGQYIKIERNEIIK